MNEGSKERENKYRKEKEREEEEYKERNEGGKKERERTWIGKRRKAGKTKSIDDEKSIKERENNVKEDKEEGIRSEGYQ